MVGFKRGRKIFFSASSFSYKYLFLFYIILHNFSTNKILSKVVKSNIIKKIIHKLVSMSTSLSSPYINLFTMFSIHCRLLSDESRLVAQLGSWLQFCIHHHCLPILHRYFHLNNHLLPLISYNCSLISSMNLSQISTRCIISPSTTILLQPWSIPNKAIKGCMHQVDQVYVDSLII